MRTIVLLLTLSLTSTFALATPATHIKLTKKQAGTSKIQQHTLILRAQPHSNSKVVTTLPQGSIIIPIFKKGKWIKVGSPLKGDVGWVSQDNIKQGTYTQIYVKSLTRKATSSQQPDAIRKINEEQAVMNEAIKQFTQHGMKSIENFNKQIANILKHMDTSHQLVIPIIQPVIYVPKGNATANNTGNAATSSIEGYWKSLWRQIKEVLRRIKQEQTSN